MSKNPKIFLLCYPHFGSLDVWLPVISRMGELKKNLKFTLIIPNVITIKALHEDNSLVRISDNMLDSVLIHVYGDVWIKHVSILDVIDWYKKNKNILRLLDVYGRISDRHLFFYFLTKPLVFLFRNKIYKNQFKYKNLDDHVSKIDILLYDVHSENNPMVLDVVSLFYRSNKYSLLHGIDLRGADGANAGTQRAYINKNNINIYAISETQAKYYELRYGFDKKEVRVVGIPRHDKRWISKIQRYSPKMPDNFNEKTIVILTVPMSRFDYKYRIRALNDIKDIFIDKLMMKVIIKLHPNEKKERLFNNKKENVYEKIFGLSNYGLTWIYSDMHTFALGKNKELVISFGTGVAFDLVAIGTPCVEYTEFSYNFKDNLTDYVKYGLIEGVSNYHELNDFVKRHLKNKNNVLIESRKIYNKYCPVFDDSSGVIAIEILQDNNIIS